MGSIVEINDTLQITRKQGFPAELDYERHTQSPLKSEQLVGKIFEFNDKTGIRIYHAPPVRNFLVENKDGKWLYWGLIHVIEVRHDYLSKITSGKFQIIHINSPEEMIKAHELIDRNPETRFE